MLARTPKDDSESIPLASGTQNTPPVPENPTNAGAKGRRDVIARISVSEKYRDQVIILSISANIEVKSSVTVLTWRLVPEADTAASHDLQPVY